jgi:hypothetical protein
MSDWLETRVFAIAMGAFPSHHMTTNDGQARMKPLPNYQALHWKWVATVLTCCGSE